MSGIIRIRNLIDYESGMKLRTGELPGILTGYRSSRNSIGTPIKVLYYNGIPGHLLLLKNHNVPVFVPLFVISVYFCKMYEANDTRYYSDINGKVYKEKYDYRNLPYELENPIVEKCDKYYLYDNIPGHTYVVRSVEEFSIFVQSSSQSVDALFKLFSYYYFIK